jgi:L-lactate dehydrogenase
MVAVKIGVVGVGAVGSATTLSLRARRLARANERVDRNATPAHSVGLDMRDGTPLVPPVNLRAGGHDDLAGADLLIVTAGVNEAAGGATDRNDPVGRLRLLDRNVEIYRDLIPRLVAAAPEATIMVVTDPPDPLAELTRALAGHDRVFSTGTVLDSLRFRVHLGDHLGVCAADVQAFVIGEHGTSQVLLWSSATVAGVPVLDLLTAQGKSVQEIRDQIATEIRYANINIIEGIGASQYGIGAVNARLAEAVLRDEQAVFTVAAYHPGHKVTLSLLSVLGRAGVTQMHHPRLTERERDALEESARILRRAVERIL